MDGGEYKTQGADTCVYIPHVACARKSKTIRNAPPGTEFVSRITRDEYEVKVQKAVVKALDAIASKGAGISNFFNLADSACAPKFKPEDKKERCTVDDLQSNQGLINLVTPVQGDTLFRSILAKSKPDALIKSSLKGLMLAMVQLNAEKVTHSDSHFNNLGWMGDQLVIFDWGRGTVGPEPFKAWVRRYLSWNKAKQEEWKRLSQHTLQFSLLDLYPAQLTVMSSKGLFATIMSAWDTLGLLGPARAAGVVSEEKAKAFADEIFKSIKEKPKQSLTEKLTVMIPALFGDPPAIHPIVAEKPMPPAEAKAVSRIIPVNNPESSVVEVKAAPVATDRKLEDMKDACRKLLAPGGGRRRTFRRREHRGGVFKDSGFSAITFESGEGEEWRFLPYAVKADGNPVPYDEIGGLGDPKAYVAYISVDDKIIDKHDRIKAAISSADDDPVGKITNTYVRAYKCNLNEMIKRDETGWVRDGARLKRRVKQFNSDITIGQSDTIEFVFENAEGYCLIVPKFEQTLARLSKPDRLKPLFDILHGLVAVDGTFVINDLHVENMAIMRDGRGVTFDYDRLCSPEEFGPQVEKIRRDRSGAYDNRPQYAHIRNIEHDVVLTDADLDTLTRISDILAVLTVVEESAITNIAAIRTCRAAVWAAKYNKTARGDAITALEKVVLPSRGGTRRRKRHQKGGDYLAGGADTLVWEQKPTPEETAAGLPKWLGLPIALTTEDESGRRIPEKPVIPPGFATLDTYGNPVVRMVLMRDGEMEGHRALKKWSGLPENKFVKMHLNTFAGSNGVYSTHPKVVLKNVSLLQTPEATANPVIKAALTHNYFTGADVVKKKSKVLSADQSKEWYGLITRRQKSDIFALQTEPAILNLLKLTQPLLRIDGFWIHYDLHTGNMAIMPDDTPVIHDYGCIKFRDYDLIPLNAASVTAPWIGNTNVLRNVLSDVKDRKDYLKGFEQFYYTTQFVPDIINRLNESCFNGIGDGHDELKIKPRRTLERVTTNDKKSIARELAVAGSLYAEKPVQALVSGSMTEKPMTTDEFEKGLLTADPDAYLKTLYKDPVYETRYHHLARIWDILAVMRAVSVLGIHAATANTADPVIKSKYENVRTIASAKAWKLISDLYRPQPIATRTNVKTVVNEFCSNVSKELGKLFISMTDDEQNALGVDYWASVNLARTGPKAMPVAPPGGGIRVAGGDTTDGELDPVIPLRQANESPIREPDISRELQIHIAKARGLPVQRIDRPIATVPTPVPAAPPPPPKGGKLTRRRRLPRLY